MCNGETTPTTLSTWTRGHAWLMLSSLMLASVVTPLPAIGAIAASSFAVLAYLARTQWTPHGRYGLANAITAFRFVIVVLLSTLQSRPTLAFALALMVLLLDGVDGWQARRSQSCSAYGELFDQEVDAFFTLSLSLILHHTGDFGVWILIPGALRYAYLLHVGSRAGRPGARSHGPRWTRAAGAYTLGSLTVCLLPLGFARTLIGAAATIVVTVSFLHSFRADRRR